MMRQWSARKCVKIKIVIMAAINFLVQPRELDEINAKLDKIMAAMERLENSHAARSIPVMHEVAHATSQVDLPRPTTRKGKVPAVPRKAEMSERTQPKPLPRHLDSGKGKPVPSKKLSTSREAYGTSSQLSDGEAKCGHVMTDSTVGHNAITKRSEAAKCDTIPSVKIEDHGSPLGKQPAPRVWHIQKSDSNISEMSDLDGSEEDDFVVELVSR